MRRWTPSLALLLVVTSVFTSAALTHAAPGNPASAVFRGLPYAPLGSCVATVDAGGRLVVSNIGSSGQDGVSFSCLHMEGVSLSLDGSCTSADAGALCGMTQHFRSRSAPQGTPDPVLNWTIEVRVQRIEMKFADDQMSSSPTQTVTLSRDGVAVYTAEVPAGSVASVAMDASGACPNPTLSCAESRTYTAGRFALCYAAASFPQVVHVSVAGHDEDCDGVSFSAPLDSKDQDCDGVSCDLLVSSPPGSSFSSVRCSDGSCRLQGRDLSGLGASALSSVIDNLRSRLTVSNLGSSGQDGVRVGLGKCPIERADVNGAAVASEFAPPGLVFDPTTDDGAVLALTVTGQSFSSVSPGQTTQVSILMQASMSGGALHLSCDHSQLGAVVESLVVIRQGVEVARGAMYTNGVVQVTAPPGGPPVAAVASWGLKHEAAGHVTLYKAPMSRAGGPALPAASGGEAGYIDISAHVHASFSSDRVFVVGGLQATGDELEFWGGPCSSGSCSSSLAVSSSSLSVTCPNPASALSSLSLLGFSSAGSDEIFADPAPTTALSTAHTCVTVPVDFARTDATPVRAFSVTFHLSPELASCGAGVAEGDYLSSVSSTNFFVTDNGGGSFTVDCAQLGTTCGSTGNGRLFTVDLGAVQPPVSSVGAVTIDAVTVRDCSNHAVVASPGSDGFIPIQFTAPPAASGLTAVQQKSGNTVAGASAKDVTSVVVTVSGPGLSLMVDLYRKGFGNYPLYSRGSTPGAVPSPPATPAAALSSGWTPVTCNSGACSSSSCSSTGCSTTVVDAPPTRDVEYYVAFVRDAYGNTSPVSSMTPGTLDYFLGDVSDGTSACTGDDHVDIADVSLLGSHYGASVSSNPALACLDVGPTLDYSVDTRPTVDGKISFEDLMMFAIDYAWVSAPQFATRPALQAANAVTLSVPEQLPAVGETFEVPLVLDGAGDALGVSVKLAFDPAVLEQVGVASGALIDAQGRGGLVVSAGAGDVDAALLGAGPGLAGHGELARVTFRVKAAGDAKLGIAGVSGRDVANRPVAFAGSDVGAAGVARTGLGIVFPNPFRDAVEIRLSLRRDGAAKLAVYDVAGRRVRTLLSGVQPSGTRTVAWDGADDSGLRLAPGAYVVRLEAGDRVETRTVRLVR